MLCCFLARMVEGKAQMWWDSLFPFAAVLGKYWDRKHQHASYIEIHLLLELDGFEKIGTSSWIFRGSAKQAVMLWDLFHSLVYSLTPSKCVGDPTKLFVFGFFFLVLLFSSCWAKLLHFAGIQSKVDGTWSCWGALGWLCGRLTLELQPIPEGFNSSTVHTV